MTDEPVKIRGVYPKTIPPFPTAQLKDYEGDAIFYRYALPDGVPVVIATAPGRLHVYTAENEIDFDIHDKNVYAEAIRNNVNITGLCPHTYVLYGIMTVDDPVDLSIFRVYDAKINGCFSPYRIRQLFREHDIYCEAHCNYSIAKKDQLMAEADFYCRCTKSGANMFVVNTLNPNEGYWVIQEDWLKL